MKRFEGIPPEERIESEPNPELIIGLVAAREVVTQVAVDRGLQLHLKGLPSTVEHQTTEEIASVLADRESEVKVSEVIVEIADGLDKLIEANSPELED